MALSYSDITIFMDWDKLEAVSFLLQLTIRTQSQKILTAPSSTSPTDIGMYEYTKVSRL